MRSFKCLKCGACCHCFPIFASRSDAKREPRIKEFGKELQPWLATKKWRYQLHPLPFLNGCAFLDENNKCRIYQTRPLNCRNFKPGGFQCIEARKREDDQDLNL
ncbi:MAG: YkgJ family cysteine cluster protein [SAR324 cluster bacterium]|uniref:YkgJ family cysteine cluster protein n=1 Tax=SAR324 cluster bacterium TaxID=2024889 RepID=A0A7X9FU79_9DELT|nr:YkgJ family cysteine cluster protein [SAR324 cluster bacterium]